MSNDTYEVLHHEGQGWKAVPSAAAARPPREGRPRYGWPGGAPQHPWRAIAAWVIFVILCTVGGGMVGTKTLVDDSNPRTESGHADRIVTGGHFNDPATENILITAQVRQPSTTPPPSPSPRRQPRACGHSPRSSAVEPAVTAANGRAVLVPVTMAGDPDTASDRVATLQAVTATVQRGHPDLRVEEVGDASLDKAISDHARR